MGCYIIWGMQPVYWALLDKFSSMFVMCIRVIMAVFFMYLYLACTGRLKEVAALVKDRQKMKYIALPRFSFARTGRFLYGPSPTVMCWTPPWAITSTP